MDCHQLAVCLTAAWWEAACCVTLLTKCFGAQFSSGGLSAGGSHEGEHDAPELGVRELGNGKLRELSGGEMGDSKSDVVKVRGTELGVGCLGVETKLKSIGHLGTES